MPISFDINKDQVYSNTSRSGYVKCHAFFMFKKQYAKPKFMSKDYSRKIGKKGYHQGHRISRNTITNGMYINKINNNNGKQIMYLGEIALHVSKRCLNQLRKLLF